MAHSYHHALSSVKKWGGTFEDTIALHTWFDASKCQSAANIEQVTAFNIDQFGR